MVVLDDGPELHSPVLRGEGHHGGGAAEGRGHGAGVEVVRAHDAGRGELLDVDVAVDPAREDVEVTGVELAAPRRQRLAERADAAAVDPDVAVMSRVVAVVDISFTCDPLLVYDWETGLTQPTTAGRLEYASVAIVQASGRSIASGTAEFSGGDVVCDGTTANIRSAAVVASTLPWKSGGAVAGASIYVTDGEYQSSHSASSGPISVKLGK